ncbi:MAG: hypothetical protein IPI58_05840 [Alphaproteobacteria bacterium]|nr:MAG: hypothetical protein IPI58_05840 [Alphaproteobacteria bacterium]
MIPTAPVFYDCEASGLDGYVIEIGWAFVRPQQPQIVSAACLVRPPAAWEIEDSWDTNAEELHGLSLEQVRHQGLAVETIAARMNRELEGRELFSDSPYDEAWARQIFEAADVEPAFVFRRMDADILLAQMVAARGLDLDRYRQAREQAEHARRHRAEADALLWAELWRWVTEGG